MPRPRLPSIFAIVLLTIRALATVLSTLVIVFLLYMTIIFGKTFAWAYTAVGASPVSRYSRSPTVC